MSTDEPLGTIDATGSIAIDMAHSFEDLAFDDSRCNRDEMSYYIRGDEITIITTIPNNAEPN